MGYKLKNISVLIVDSQPAIISLIKSVLLTFGVQEVYTCTDGNEGLRAFENHKPDLMIIDFDLPGMDGIAFTKAVRSGPHHPFVPIIFMTSASSKKRVTQARDSGITEFLVKPFTAEALYKRIEAIVERPRPFVRAPEFFGPDRRRKRDDKFGTRDRRESDPTPASLRGPPPKRR